LKFDVGTSGGSDTLYARLMENNGALTPWAAFTVTVPQPTLAVANDPSAGKSQTIALSTLVTIADPNGLSFQKLELWDSNGTAASGQFIVNGAPQTGGHAIDVLPADLTKTIFQAGTSAGTDTVWADLLQKDGTSSGWELFTITIPAPALGVHNDPSAAPRQQIALSSLVTISDPSNVGYQKLELWDTNGTASGGQLVINSVPQSGAHEIDVAASAINSIVFNAGTAAGTDALWARLLQNDGSTTDWQKFSVTVPAPVLSVHDFNGATAGQQIALSTLVTISDPANVSFQKLELWDSNGSVVGGQFVVNGIAQTAGHAIDVSPGNVRSVVFNVGTSGATDTLYAQLIQDDGSKTDWLKFTVRDPLTVATGSTAEIQSAYAGAVTFAGDTGTLRLDNSAGFIGTVAGMTGQDTLDLADIDPLKVQQPSFAGNSSGGTLTVTDGTHAANIALLGNYMASVFVTGSDGHGGTTVHDPQVLGGVQPLVTPPHA
jgi:hypothetical protein